MYEENDVNSSVNVDGNSGVNTNEAPTLTWPGTENTYGAYSEFGQQEKPEPEVLMQQAEPAQEAPRQQAEPAQEAPRQQAEPAQEAPRQQAEPAQEAPRWQETPRWQEAPRQETPRWQADPERYNQRPMPPKPPKRPGRGWIPATIVLAVALVLVIAVGAVMLISTNMRISALTSNLSTFEESSSDSATIINQNDTSGSSEYHSSSGYVLTDVSAVVDEVLPSVVSITSRTLVQSGGWYGYFWGGSGQTQEVDSGLGSGTIIAQNSSEVLILTSNHVVDGASSLSVAFGNDVSVDGYTKAYDSVVDIAIVAVPIEDIDAETLDYISIAKVSTELPDVGDGVIVIGNALGYGISVTTGTVSALDRIISDDSYGITTTVIQTDAAINNGNSGGCMLNANGEIVGISEAKVTVSNAEGMCYAIQVATYYDQIMSMLEEDTSSSNGNDSGTASASSGQSAYLGINGADVTEDLSSVYGMPEGVYVASVVSGGGAEVGGIQSGDIIVAVNGEDTTTMDALKEALSGYEAGDIVTVTVLRSDAYGNYSQVTLLVELMSESQVTG